MEDNLLKTCLYDRHIAAGGQMSPFAGYDMPIQYTSIIDEHNAVRNHVGMFDVSHMGEIFVSGKDAEKFVNHVFSNDVSGIPSGKVLYGMLLNPQGGVVDDLLVYKEFEPDHYLLVVNAANIAKDFGWLQTNAEGYDVTVQNGSFSWGEIALQGPEAEKVMTDVLHLDAAASLTFYTYCEMQWNGKRLIVSRTGYTGEDGFELYSSDEKKREENLKARKKELTAEKEKADAQLSRLVARLQRFGKFWIEALDRSSLLSLDFGRLGGSFGNENAVGQIFMFAILFLGYFSLIEKKHTISNLILILFLLGFVFLTGSRGALLLSITILLVSAFLAFKGKKKNGCFT